MGSQVGAVCYPTPKSAALAWASGLDASAVELAPGCIGVMRVTVAGDDNSPTIEHGWQVVAGQCAAPAATVVGYAAVPCQLLDYEDAAGMAWAVVACWAAAWGIARLLRKAVL